jgi:glutathione S-transferase
VPVLLTIDNKVIEESNDVMHWALKQNDPDNWLDEDEAKSQYLIDYNDNEFKHFLDRYKYYVGYPEQSQEYYRENAESFLKVLENNLAENNDLALLGNRLSLADIAIFPFVRQFARVDLDWFQASPYKSVIQWLSKLEESDLFKSCMKKYAQWLPGHEPVYFPV